MSERTTKSQSMKFEWDANKNTLNQNQHGVSFEKPKKYSMMPGTSLDLSIAAVTLKTDGLPLVQHVC